MEFHYLSKTKAEENTFYYLEVGDMGHGRPCFHLWVNRKLVQVDEREKEYISFPMRDAKIIRTEKGNLVLRPYQGWNTFRIGVGCGYRGRSRYEILAPKEEIEVFPFKELRSPRGSLGVCELALVSCTSESVKIRWERTGRVYGGYAKGITIYYATGQEENIYDIADGLEALQELKQELE